MKALTFLTIAGLILVMVPECATAEITNSTSLLLVFTLPSGNNNEQTDAEIVAGVIQHMRAAEIATVLSFSPELPIVSRAVLEHRVDQRILNQITDYKKASQVARVVGARYAVCVRGSIVKDTVRVILDLVDVPSGEHWAVAAESQIPGGAPAGSLIRSNAISNAASSAVSQLVIAALGKKTFTPAKPVSENPPSSTERKRNLDAEYNDAMKQAKEARGGRNFRTAIFALKCAINLRPENIEPRLRLAEIYHELNMLDEALDECKRALLFKPDDLAVHTMAAKLHLEKSSLEEAVRHYREVIRLSPNDIDTRITLGDVLWNLKQIESAEAAYLQAAEVAPDNTLPHERLLRLYTARKLYPKALDHMFKSKTLAKGIRSDDHAKYRILAQIIQDEFEVITKKIETSNDEYRRGIITREEYYQNARDVSAHADALAQFLSLQVPPSKFQQAHSHLTLAVSLLSQSAGTMVSYLETSKEYYLEQAGLLRAEARTEMNIFVSRIRGI